MSAHKAGQTDAPGAAVARNFTHPASRAGDFGLFALPPVNQKQKKIMKTKISFTLDEYYAQVLEKAVRTVCCTPGCQNYDVTSRDRTWIIRMAVQAVSAAIIRAGKMATPFSVEFRPESEKETEDRMNGIIPTNPGNSDFLRFRLPPPGSNLN
jgi:hypothetical protein